MPHLPPPLPPQLLPLLPELPEEPQLPQPLLPELPEEPQLPQPLLPPLLELLLLQPPPPDEPPDDELPLHPPPPPPLLLELESHESQLPPQPLWLLELAQLESHDSELPQLGPEQLQFGDAWQLLLSQELPQLTLVERGGSLVPASMPGPGNEPLGAPKIDARQPSSALLQVMSSRKSAFASRSASESAALVLRAQLAAFFAAQSSTELIASAALMQSRK